MLSVQYIFAFSMIYLTLFRILNFEQKRNVKWLNLTIFALLAIWNVNRGFLIAGTYDAIIGLGLVLLVGVYAIDGFKSLRAWLSIIGTIFIAFFVTLLTTVFILISRGYSLDLLEYLINENTFYTTIGMIAGAALLFIMYYLFVKKLNLKVNIYALSKAEVGIILFFLAMFGVFVTAIFEFSSNRYGLASVVINFSAFFSGIVGIYFIVYLATQRSTIYEIQNREKQQELIFDEQKQNYERMEKRNEEVSIFKHSIRDELLYLDDLLHKSELEKARAYLTKMRGRVVIIEQAVGQDTGSNAVNASWYSLTNSKRYTEIAASWLGRIPAHILIDDRDLVLLFSNLLNNAFEAAKKASDKYVSVKVDNRENGLFVLVKNSYYGEIVEKFNGEFVTTKDDKESHGIGVRIIKNVVEKYCGKVKFNYSDGEFVVTIIFSVDICKAD